MSIFQFRDFAVRQTNSALKVGTDAMIFGASINSYDKLRALDIGTGTGVLSLMVAQCNTEIKIDSIDVNREALQDAGFNFENSPYAKRLNAIHCDFVHFDSSKKYDLIFSNPPFYTDNLKGENESLNLAKHVGVLTPRVLMKKVSRLLNETGSFWVIWPSERFRELSYEANLQDFFVKHKTIVFGKPKTPKRIIAEFVKHECEVVETALTVRDDKGKYTAAYITLTKEFHDRAL